MNSSIACLSNCTELTTFFLTKEYKKYKNTSNKNGLNGKLADGWYLLLKDYWKGDKTYGNPKVIKKLIAKKDKKFEDDEQQDANEFIVKWKSNVKMKVIFNVLKDFGNFIIQEIIVLLWIYFVD